MAFSSCSLSSSTSSSYEKGTMSMIRRGGWPAGRGISHLREEVATLKDTRSAKHGVKRAHSPCASCVHRIYAAAHSKRGGDHERLSGCWEAGPKTRPSRCCCTSASSAGGSRCGSVRKAASTAGQETPMRKRQRGARDTKRGVRGGDTSRFNTCLVGLATAIPGVV